MRYIRLQEDKVEIALEILLRSLFEKFKIIAPLKKSGVLEFNQIDDNSKNTIESVIRSICNDELPYKSPKEFLFPQVEELMVFDNEQDTVKEVLDDSGRPGIRKTVIFGVRPCDLEALKILKTIFCEGAFKDDRIAARRENIILIGVGCKDKKPGCFCDERGINKDFSKDCDIFISNDKILSFSEKGNSILELAVFDDISKKETKKGILKEESNTNYIEESNTDYVNTDYIEEISTDYIMEKDFREEKYEEKYIEELIIDGDENALFNKIDWDRIVEGCLGCGICTYICPTCHCFDFKDVYKDGKTTRYRRWDSCMYPKFTVHASGHNPRPTKKERYRQRILHKYLYIKKNYGYTACTGCGRCIRSCPAGMNIKNVIKDIMEELKSE